MLGLPKDTEISRPIYKKTLLENFTGTPKQKDIFNKEILTIRIVNEISVRSLPALTPSEEISGIYFIHIETKQEAIHLETIETIFKLINQHLVLVFSYEDRILLAIHSTRTFLTDWLESDYTLKLDALSIDGIWQQLVGTIGNFEVKAGKSLEEQITQNSKIQILLDNIEKLEKKKNTTKTPRMKYELHLRIAELTEKLEELKRS